MHGFRCYDDTHICYDNTQVCKLTALHTANAFKAPNATCQRVLLFTLWLVENCNWEVEQPREYKQEWKLLADTDKHIYIGLMAVCSGRPGSACISFSPPHFWTCGSSWDRPKLFICFKTPSTTSSSGHRSLSPSSYVVVQHLIQSVSFLHSKLPSSWDRQTDRERERQTERKTQRRTETESCSVMYWCTNWQPVGCRTQSQLPAQWLTKTPLCAVWLILQHLTKPLTDRCQSSVL